MRVRPDFDPADPGETEVFAFDYSADIALNEALTGATFSIQLISGIDAAPSSRLSGSATVNQKEGGTRDVLASQRIADLQPGCRYRISCLAVTSLGNTVSLYSHVACRDLE